MTYGKLSDRFKENEELEIILHKPKRGKFPIGKSETGVTCLFEPNNRNFYEYGSTWRVKIVEVKKDCLIIKPLNCIRSKSDNEKVVKNTLTEAIASGTGIFANCSKITKLNK